MLTLRQPCLSRIEVPQLYIQSPRVYRTSRPLPQLPLCPSFGLDNQIGDAGREFVGLAELMFVPGARVSQESLCQKKQMTEILVISSSVLRCAVPILVESKELTRPCTLLEHGIKAFPARLRSVLPQIKTGGRPWSRQAIVADER